MTIKFVYEEKTTITVSYSFLENENSGFKPHSKKYSQRLNNTPKRTNIQNNIKKHTDNHTKNINVSKYQNRREFYECTVETKKIQIRKMFNF